jgi:regulator of sigma E protease
VASVNDQYHGAFGTTTLLGDLRSRAGESVRLGIERPDGGSEVVTVTLRSAAQIDVNHGALGIEDPSPTTTRVGIHYSIPEAVGLGTQRTVEALGLIVGGLGQVGDAIINRPTEPPPVAGPVGIATQIGDIFWQLGPIITLYVGGILSANLAVVNILPFPPLDGGRMLVITLKRIFGARISLRAERMTYVVGFVFLFAFLIWITGFDIARGLSGGS